VLETRCERHGSDEPTKVRGQKIKPLTSTLQVRRLENGVGS